MPRLTCRTLMVLGLSLLFCASSLWAQSNRATITGTVTDPSGAVIAGATVTATNTATGLSTKTTSSSSGTYTIPLLQVGTYEVSAEATGFKRFIAPQVILEVGQTVSLEVHMQVGAVTQTVEVTGAAAPVQRDTSDRGTVVSSRDVLELPIAGVGEQRNPAYFMILAPGVTGRGVSYSGSPRMLNTTVNGSQSASNEFQVDGALIGNGAEWAGDFRNIPFPQDAVGEYKVMTLLPPAEYGRTGQGITSFTIRSGSNQIHGSAYEFLRNNALDSRGFFAPKTPINKQNEFGGTVGGPIRKDKTFFFGWYQGFKLRKSVTNRLDTVPTAAMRGGDLSNTLGPVMGTDALGRPVYQGEIYDPATQRTVAAGAVDPVTGLTNTSGSSALLRDGFGFNPATGAPIAGSANIIPSNRIDPLAAKIFSYFPNPTAPGQAFGYRNNWLVSYPTQTNVNEWGTKIDHAIGDKHRLMGEFMWLKNYNPSGSVWPGAISEGAFNYSQQDIARFSHDWFIRPNLINHWVAGFNRWRSDSYPEAGTGWPGKIGYSGVPQTGPGSTFIEMDIGGLGNTYGRGGQGYSVDNAFTFDESLTWTRGRHTIKAGMSYVKIQQNDLSTAYQSSYLTFNGGTTGLPGQFYNDGCSPGGQCTGMGAAGFLLGLVSKGETGIVTAENAARLGQWSGYIQDDFKATPKLTVNLGLRYDLLLPVVSAHNQMSWMDPDVPNPGAGGLPGAMFFATPSRRNPTSAFTKGFGPRIGLAYSLNDKTVIRTGYGILYTTGGAQRVTRGQYLQGWNEINNVLEDNSLGFTGLLPGTVIGHPDYHMILSQGWPAQFYTPPPFISPTFDLGAGPTMASRADGRPPDIQNWTFGIQRQIPGQILLDIAYVGTKGTHLVSRMMPTSAVPTKYINLPLLKSIADPTVQALSVVQGMPVDPATGNHTPFPGFEALWGGNATLGQALRPRPQYTSDTVEGLAQMRDFMEGVGVSSYNALQIQARKHFSQGLSFLLSYTWSKTLTDSESIYNEFSGWTQDFYNRKAEKALSINDYPSNLVLSYEYQLPLGPGKKFANVGGPAGKVVGGWSIAGIQQYQSGRPEMIYTGSNPYSNYIGPNNFIMRPNVVPGVPKYSTQWLLAKAGLHHFDPNVDPMLNIAAWADPAVGTLGNAPRSDGSVRLPKYMSEDISLLKRTPVTERVNIEFRADFLNIFNRTILGPDQGGDQYDSILQGNAVDWGAGSFGHLASQGNYPREIQFGLKINF